MDDFLLLVAVASTPEIPTETRFPEHFPTREQQEPLSQDVLGRVLGCFCTGKEVLIVQRRPQTLDVNVKKTEGGSYYLLITQT